MVQLAGFQIPNLKIRNLLERDDRHQPILQRRKAQRDHLGKIKLQNLLLPKPMTFTVMQNTNPPRWREHPSFHGEYTESRPCSSRLPPTGKRIHFTIRNLMKSRNRSSGVSSRRSSNDTTLFPIRITRSHRATHRLRARYELHRGHLVRNLTYRIRHGLSQRSYSSFLCVC